MLNGPTNVQSPARRLHEVFGRRDRSYWPKKAPRLQSAVSVCVVRSPLRSPFCTTFEYVSATYESVYGAVLQFKAVQGCGSGRILAVNCS
jgi:hypothetical protein